MRYKRNLLSTLVIPAILALLPILALAGGSHSTARAGAPPVAPATQQEEEILVLRVYFSSFEERNRIATEFGADEFDTLGGYLTFWGDRDMYESFRARGMRVEIDPEGTRDANLTMQQAPNAPGTFYGGYRTVEEMETFLDQKVAAHPTLAQKVDVGDSWCKTHPGQCTQPNTWNGYDLWALQISNQAIPGPKPVFWFDSGIHSREIATPEVAMRFIDDLLNNYNSNADARWLVDHHDIWVMPMLNPDGHHMVENGANQPRSQRKNADRDDGCTTWPPPGIGTDLNRNFPFLWGCCGGSSGSACSETYRGPSAASEEETQAVVAKIRQLIPDQRGPGNNDPAPINTTGILQSMHSVAELNLYPWGWTNTDAPNHADLDNIARHMSSLNASPPGNNYVPCQPGECLYNVDGDSFDFQYGELGVPGYTTELSGNSFYPAYSCLDNPGCGNTQGIWQENRGMLLYMAKIARTPYLTTRGPDTSVVATNPMTVTQGTPVELSATINYNWTAPGSLPNRYLQSVGGAEYYINTPPWAGGTGIPMQPTDGSFNTPTEGAQATIDTSSIPPGTYVVFVRGRGVNDYSGLGSWGAFTAAFLTVTPGGGATPTVGPPTGTPVPPTVAPSATATATPTCAIGTVDVAIEDFAFNPQNVTIPAGSTIRWTNNGQAPHTSTSTTALWDSGTLNTGQQFSHTFNTPGSFPYLCEIHPSMVGTITVTAACPTSTVMPTPSRTVTLPPLPTNTVAPSSTTAPTNTTGPTNTPGGPTETPAPPTNTSVPPTNTAVQPTATACTIMFTDVPTTHTFYSFIRCLACRNIISGYADGTFKPENNITRGQISKMVSNAAGFNEPVSGQTFEDVSASNTFYQWIQRLATRGIMSGYPCGGTGEPCGPGSRPYFRWQLDATRGQLSKIVSEAAGFNEPIPPTQQTFTDVPSGNPFWVFIERLADRGVIGGYPCGGAGEPCDSESRPYFRWGFNVTRGQASKIVANTFYPRCETP